MPKSDGGSGRRGPLVLGAGGRVGTMWRRLAAAGLWPGPEPVWHTRDGRDGTLGWAFIPEPPNDLDFDGVCGVICLAGRTTGDADDLAKNTDAALHAMDLARTRRLGPILLCSSAAIYGRARGLLHEDDDPEPAAAYGQAKLDMEQSAIIERCWKPHEAPPTCALRIGNVAGADALFGAMAAGLVTLDRLPDGAAPRRAYVGPLTLARAMVALLARPDLPPVLNLAQPGLVAMSDVLAAAGVPWEWRDAPDALPALEMDLSRVQALAPLPPAAPDGLVAEARLAGWRPWGGA